MDLRGKPARDGDDGGAAGESRHEIGSAFFGTAVMEVPRLALATAAAGPEPSVMALALLAGLTEKCWRVQHFRTRACPTVTEVVGQVTGLPGRHLDSWLMPEAVCRSLFRGELGGPSSGLWRVRSRPP